jgi:hypothetical protein
VGHLVPDPGEVVQGQVHVGLAGDGEQVQDRVGRSPERHHHGDRVVEGRLREHLASGDALPQHLDDGLAGAVREAVPPAVDGRWRGRAGQRHAQCLGNRGHRVGGVHAAAGALAGTDGPLDPVHLLPGYQPTKAGPDRLERVDDGDLTAIDLTGHDRAGVHEHAGQVEPCRCHQHARQGLVTPGEQHRPVETLSHHHRLDRVGDHLARHQREVHALVAHRDAVGDRDGAELQRVATRSVHAVLDRRRQPVEREVARGDLVPARGDPDLRLGEVCVAHADRAQHPAGGRLLQPVGDVAAARLEVDVATQWRALVGG